jgi:hypothetical protein
MKSFTVNWKTTLMGLMAVAAAAGPLASDIMAHKDNLLLLLSDPSVQTHFAGFAAAIGLIFAKDGNVTGGTKQQ